MGFEDNVVKEMEVAFCISIHDIAEQHVMSEKKAINN